MDSVVVIALSVLATLIILMLLGGFALFYYFMRKIKNNIDIVLVEVLGDRNFIVRRAIGRWDQDPNRGRRLVSAGFGISSIKEVISYQLKDEDLAPSAGNRKCIIIARKDRLSIPLRLGKKFSQMTDEEKKVLDALYQRNITKVKFPEFPAEFNLTPIIYEQQRFVLDANKDAQNLHRDSALDKAYSLAKWAVIGAIVVFTLCLLAFILMMILGPDAAKKAVDFTSAAPAQPLPPG